MGMVRIFFNLHDVTKTVCYDLDKTGISCSKFLSPGGQLGQIQHLRGLNSIALGYLDFTAGLT